MAKVQHFFDINGRLHQKNSYLCSSYSIRFYMKTDILLILPPLVQPNCCYPSITHLTEYLRAKNINANQLDLSIELLSGLFTANNIDKIFGIAEAYAESHKVSKKTRIILSNRQFYVNTIEPAMEFLRGNAQELATRFAQPSFWQDAQRLPSDEDLEFDFGIAGTIDRAKHLCSIFLKDLCDIIAITDPNFQLIRYAEHISTYLETFKPIEEELAKPASIVTQLMLSILDRNIEQYNPETIGFSIPFPGNLLSAMQCCKHIRKTHPDIKIIIGGGYVNTELRQINDPSIFRYIDYLTFDDGELPLLNILTEKPLIRTITFDGNSLQRHNMASKENESIYTMSETPCFSGNKKGLYFNFVDTTNPMHRLWSDGQWNKIMLAHGCYWHKCAFCDTSLDYICNYFPHDTKRIVDIMEAQIEATGSRGFHFVDEAAPPALLRKLAEEILNRKLTVTYWTNIRFDSTFTPELCYLLAKSGCIAVSGGLEVASPRVLKLINKGVTIESAAQCMRNLRANNIMVHTYLMYGFPTQTVNELFDSLKSVRDMFAEGLIQSAFWHRFAMTTHAPAGNDPDFYHAKRLDKHPNIFANNEVPFTDNSGIEWDKYSEGLYIATYNFMRQTGFEIPIKNWFKY